MLFENKRELLLDQNFYPKSATVFAGDNGYVEGYYKVFVTRGNYNVEPTESENHYELIFSDDFIGFVLQYKKILSGLNRSFSENVFDNRDERIKEEVDNFLKNGNLGKAKYQVKKTEQDDWQEIILEIKADNFKEFDNKIIETAKELEKNYESVVMPCETRALYYIFDNQINLNA